jgi:hypothetical protein
MRRISVPTCHAFVQRNLTTNIAVKPARKQARKKWRLHASATMELAR